PEKELKFSREKNWKFEFNHDKTRFFSVCNDGIIRIWDFDLNLVQEINCLPKQHTRVYFNRDWTKLITLVWNEPGVINACVVQIWDIKTGQVEQEFKLEGLIYYFYWNYDETEIITCSDKKLRFWNTKC